MSMNVGYIQAANTRPYGYDVKFTSAQEKADFNTGIVSTPEQQEKANKTRKSLLITAGVLVAAGLTYFFTKGKGKKLIDTLIGKLKSSKEVAEEVVETASEKAMKAAETTRNIDKTHVNAKGHKFIEDALKDCPTRAEQAAYDASVAYVAPTAEQAKFIAENNKPAVNTMADILEANGLKYTKQGSKATIQPNTVVPPLKTASVAPDVATKIEDIQAKIAKCDEAIAKYEAHPAMAKYAKPHKASKAKLVKLLEELQASVKAAA